MQTRLLPVAIIVAVGAVVLAVLAIQERVVETDLDEVRTLTLLPAEDGWFDHEIAFSFTQRRVFKAWFRSERMVEEVGHGIAPSARYALRSDDETTLRSEGGRLLPVAVGETIVFAIHGDGRIDTFVVRVEQDEGHLALASEPVYRSE